MAAPRGTFVYVSNAADGDIGACRMQPDGALQPDARVKAADVVGPMAVSPETASQAVRADIIRLSRVAMIASASATMRATSSAQVGMSWIRPCTMPADQMPKSGSPSS